MKRYLFMMLCLMVFSGCGANGGSAPPTSTLSIQPVSFTASANGNADERVDSTSFIVQALDNTGKPLGNLPLTIQFEFTKAATTSPACDPTLPPAELVTLDNGQQIYNTYASAETDGATGLYTINIKYREGCGLDYAGTIQVYGSGIQTPTTATLTVTP